VKRKKKKNCDFGEMKIGGLNFVKKRGVGAFRYTPEELLILDLPLKLLSRS